MLGPGSASLWRAQIQAQGGAGGLADLLEQYAQTLAQNMKLTYLNPVALVAPNIGESPPPREQQAALFPFLCGLLSTSCQVRSNSLY